MKALKEDRLDLEEFQSQVMKNHRYGICHCGAEIHIFVETGKEFDKLAGVSRRYTRRTKECENGHKH